ncbi:MAG: Rab family GTPase [Ghiorsea sp.]
MIQKKICVLGAAGVGKTSLTAQFVYSKFSEKYLSTMGVKIDRKVVEVGDTTVNLMIWDIHGEEKYKKITTSYLRGAAGIITVIDGTRPETIEIANEILTRVHQELGVIPNIFLINKSDLKDDWNVQESEITKLQQDGSPLYLTSAKTGDNVETSFIKLAEMLLSK